MRNVTLVSIDEISMVSNVTLLYIHLQHTEIFQTQEVEDGWFGNRNMLLLGDLLQVPPVLEDPGTPILQQNSLRNTQGV